MKKYTSILISSWLIVMNVHICVLYNCVDIAISSTFIQIREMEGNWVHAINPKAV